METDAMKIPEEFIKRCDESDWDFDYDQNKIDKSRFNVCANINGTWSKNWVGPESHAVVSKNKDALNQVTANGQKAEDRFELYKIDNDWGSEYLELLNIIPWRLYSAHVHLQLPGNMHPFHMDYPTMTEMTHDEKMNTVRRCWVMLDDWHPGQVIQMGNYIWTKWKRGDVAYFDWQNLPHGTANFGHHARPIISAVGITTPEFENFIQQSYPSVIKANDTE